MFLSCSHIFGLLGAFGGAIVQEVVIWDFSEDFGSVTAAVCVIVGLVSSIVASVTILKYKHQFTFFIVFQIVSALGIVLAYFGLVLKSIPVMLCGTLIYSIFTFPSFPIMIELIGKRVGKAFELVATGNVYFLTQVVTAVVLAISGAMLNSKKRSKSTESFIFIIGLLLLNGLYGFIAYKTNHRPFNTQGLNSASTKQDRLADQVHD